jgi:uncharacterized membrane protein YfcA
MVWLWLTLLGLAVGCIGTLVGAGGGFILMPALALLYPAESPAALASISLAVVFFNALSGSIGYARQKLIDYRSGSLFLLAGVPGAILGALITSYIPRAAFDLLLGVCLILAAASILIFGALRPAPSAHAAPALIQTAHRRLLGVVISFFVGIISSLLGIGGGIVHVPAMVFLLKFPVHVAAATSHFVLAGTSLAGTIAHLAGGEYTHGFRRTAALSLGAVVGAQIGARLARRTPSTWIMRALAIALILVGVRVVIAGIAKSHA